MARPEPSDQTRQRMIQALQQGAAIEAIKLHREDTGADLVTAKQYVDALRAELGPAAAPPPAAAAGPVLLAIVAIVALALAAWKLAS